MAEVEWTEWTVEIQGHLGSALRSKLDVTEDGLKLNETRGRSLLPQWKLSEWKDTWRIFQVNGQNGNGMQLMKDMEKVKNSSSSTTTLGIRCLQTRFFHPRRLEDLPSPAPGCGRPNEMNSSFVVLRSKTDANIIRSIEGLELDGGERVEVWASSAANNRILEKEWKIKDHLFLIMLYQENIWGFARMSTAPNRNDYGAASTFFGREYAYLGDNFRIQWIFQCCEPWSSFNIQGLPHVKCLEDGHLLKPKLGFAVCNQLLSCDFKTHMGKNPERMHPGRVPYYERLPDIPYNPRKNLNRVQQDEQSEQPNQI